MKYEITETEEGMQIKNILRRKMGFSSRLLRKLKLSDGVTVNGEKHKLFEVIHKGDVIQVKFPDEESHFEPQEIPMDVIYEDEDIVIVNKQPGIVVHPTKGHPVGTVANALAYHMKKQGESYKIRFVNRLDMDTSGLLIVAKNSFAQENISKQMIEGKTTKKYIAVVDGIMTSLEGVIDLPIGIEDENAVGRVVTEKGQPSVTRYKVLRHLGEKRTEVELTLETGRTHQIRVHLAHIGHSITGDNLYGTLSGLIERQALHAAYLSFYHPRTCKQLELMAELPMDMKRLMSH